MAAFKYLGMRVTLKLHPRRSEEKIEIGLCLLPFSSECFVMCATSEFKVCDVSVVYKLSI